MLPTGISDVDRRAWTTFARAVLVCYQKPEIAIDRMARYNLDKGQDAFLMKLAVAPSFFRTQRRLARGQDPDLSRKREPVGKGIACPCLRKRP